MNIYPKISIERPKIVFMVTNSSDWDISFGKHLAALRKHGLANYLTSMVESNDNIPPTTFISKLIDGIMLHLDLHVVQSHTRSVSEISTWN